MKNVLVFPCGSEIGLELHRSLVSSPHFYLFGASSVSDHGEFVYERCHRIAAMVHDRGFAGELNALLTGLSIDYVLPAHDAVILTLAEMQRDGRLSAEAVVPGYEVCAICRSKRATYRLFGDQIPVPRLYDPSGLDDARYPLFAKPDVGQGSRGAELIPDAAAAREKLRREPESLVMEYLPGPEYTVDCFTDRTGALLFQSARLRGRVSHGISVRSRLAAHPSLVAMAHSINDLLAMRGAWFFQARENAAGEAVLLEIAPRIAGSSGLQRARGVNLALLSLYDRMGLPVRVLPNATDALEADRALSSATRLHYDYQTAYLDFDDTLYSPEAGVNTDLVKFVFQCRNRGVRVVLLSRHIGDLTGILRETRLYGIFDEVVHIPDVRSKAEYMGVSGGAVFVDDSFAERMDVAERLGIPVFDPASAEALLDAGAL
jgi:hypothetical protein